MSSFRTLAAVRKSLSEARMATFDLATGTGAKAAQDLYSWNALLSGALLMPLHICEVVTRNAISEALELQYGDQWPWSKGFERSLPDPQSGFSLRKDLIAARHNRQTVGEVISDLNFHFWQNMFTSRHDNRLWSPYLRQVLPHLETTKPIQILRSEIYQNLFEIRRLRNRIAHHEPIFARNLMADFNRIKDMISIRCPLTAQWMSDHQQAVDLIRSKP